MAFPERLKELRVLAGISQRDLSKNLYVSQQTVAKWELNKSTPNPEMLSKIATYFGVSVDYLLGRTASPGQQKTSPPFGELVQNLIEDDPEMERLYKILIHLSPDDLKKAASYLDFLRSNQENKNNP